MKNPRLRNYMYWGLTALAVIACSVVFALLLINLKTVSGVMDKIAAILMPIIYGGVLAYLMLPVYNRTEALLNALLNGQVKTESAIRKLARTGATLVSLLCLLAIIVGLVWMLIPQIYTSILGLQESMGGNIDSVSRWLRGFQEDNPVISETVIPIYEQTAEKLENWLYTEIIPNMSKIIDILSTGLLSVVTVVKNVAIGFIVMVYLLNMKETLAAQAKKIVYGLFSVKHANRIVEEVRFTHSVFGGFITGKLLDSLIIGILCFFCMNLLNMPYALLISVIIGVTNVVPFFGPFIGAIPSAFLILLISPLKCLYFLIFILVLQQFDGNILGPKILGDSTGLPSFWVLFAILLFGGLFGFVGMIIAVPTFAVIYRLTQEYIEACLSKKKLSEKTDDYRNLEYIDEDEKNYIQREK